MAKIKFPTFQAKLGSMTFQGLVLKKSISHGNTKKKSCVIDDPLGQTHTYLKMAWFGNIFYKRGRTDMCENSDHYRK